MAGPSSRAEVAWRALGLGEVRGKGRRWRRLAPKEGLYAITLFSSMGWFGG